MSEEKICFIVSPIGDEDSSTRVRSNQILKHIISPVLNNYGFTAVRADHLPEPGIITHQIIQHLINDPLVIADLTDHNPNVFYELAVRHAAKKPLIQVIQEGQKIPFDVAASRTVLLNISDLDKAEQSRSELEKQIKAITEGNCDIVDNPISTAISLQNLNESQEPLNKSLASIIEDISEIRRQLGYFDDKKFIKRLAGEIVEITEIIRMQSTCLPMGKGLVGYKSLVDSEQAFKVDSIITMLLEDIDEIISITTRDSIIFEKLQRLRDRSLYLKLTYREFMLLIKSF